MTGAGTGAGGFAARAALVAVLAGGLLGPSPARADDTSRSIRAALTPSRAISSRTAAHTGTSSAGTPSASAPSLQEIDLRHFYDQRGFRPAWTSQTSALAIAAMEHATDEGLKAADYSVGPAPHRTSGAEAAAWDMDLSRAFLRYAKDLHSGRVVPSAVYEDVDLPMQPFDAAGELNAALKSGELTAFIADLPPPRAEYGFLREALAHYRALAARGDWQVPVKAGAALTALPKALRGKLQQRLADEDPNVPAVGEAFSNADLRDAVIRFQTRLGLGKSGTLNAQTVAALNRPVIERVMQIQADMERWRWMPHVPEKRYVEVNTPEAWLKVVDDGKTILTSPVVLGRRDWPTPILATTAKAVIVNPPWHVPPDLAGEEILPKLVHNASYLAQHNMVLVDGPPADPHGLKINWRAVSAETFPYRIEQMPGAGSGLGALLLDMPNSLDVYLHDTPAKEVFGRADRFLSHGCVRVRDIDALASWALYGDPHQTDRMPKPPRTETVRVPLDEPLRVYMMYWTAFKSADGTVAFRPDVYGLDARLAGALRGHQPPPAAHPVHDLSVADAGPPAP